MTSEFVRKSGHKWRWKIVWKKTAGMFFVLTIGLSSGWILRGQESGGSIAEVYYWKAKPGKLDDSTATSRRWRNLWTSTRVAPGRSFRLPRTFSQAGLSLDAYAPIHPERPGAGCEP